MALRAQLHKSAINKPLTKISASIATIVASGVLGALIKDLWERPRPKAEIVKVSFDGRSSSTLPVPDDLIATISLHPYFPDLKTTSKSKDVHDSIEEAKAGDELMERTINRTTALINVVNTQSGRLSEDARRKQFLEELAADQGISRSIQAYMKAILGDLEDSGRLPDDYHKHPLDFKESTVALPKAESDFLLSEIDEMEYARGESQTQGPVNVFEAVRRDAHLTNLLRRLLIYYEPEMLTLVLESSREKMKLHLEGSRQIAAVLRELVPPYVLVEAVLVNRGRRPVTVREQALLRLDVPTAAALETVDVELRLQGEEGHAKPLDGGDAMSVVYISEKTVRELVVERLELLGGKGWTKETALSESKLMNLYDGDGLVGQLIVGKVGARIADSKLAESDKFPIGTAMDKNIMQALSRR